jgi:ectoine hydroxylase-related dioxygenase (phytanoyl-CoA dioxygenase family)
MDDWFKKLATSSALPTNAARELQEAGFTLAPGPIPTEKTAEFAIAYDKASANAAKSDVASGSTTTRINDFVNRGPEFDGIYVFRPLLSACCQVIGEPFKLSAMHARTLRPDSPAQELHVDVKRHADGWPLVGFILMIDEFHGDNGATRFVPGSQTWPGAPEDVIHDRRAAHEKQVLAGGPAGTLIIFNGSTWHGHTANSSGRPRRSIQGAFIPRHARPGSDFAARMQSETLSRLSPLARYILAL